MQFSQELELKETTKNAIENDIQENRIMVYMKGNPDEPRCGFSAEVIDALDALGAEYQTKDVLEDWDLRNGIKVFSNWPTIPQLYIDKEFIGGCDIVTELFRSGELEKMLGSKEGGKKSEKPEQPKEHMGECQKRCL